MTQIEQAGFVVCDDTAIWGQGKTEAEAWADMVNEMRMANIRVVGREVVELGQDETPADRYRTMPASAALMREVEDRGGNLGWYELQGIACTWDEFVD